MKAEDIERKAMAIDWLRRNCPPGSSITTRQMDHKLDRNGNPTRAILCMIVKIGLGDGVPYIVDMSAMVAHATGLRFNPDRGGCITDYDDGSVVVTDLARTLYGDAKALVGTRL